MGSARHRFLQYTPRFYQLPLLSQWAYKRDMKKIIAVSLLSLGIIGGVSADRSAGLSNEQVQSAQKAAPLLASCDWPGAPITLVSEPALIFQATR